MERSFEVRGKSVKKCKYVLSLESDLGEKLTLHLSSRNELEEWHLGDVLSIKSVRIEAQTKLEA